MDFWGYGNKKKMELNWNAVDYCMIVLMSTLAFNTILSFPSMIKSFNGGAGAYDPACIRAFPCTCC